MPPPITTIIGEFAHPPWGSLSRELIGTFSFTGSVHVLQRVRGPVTVDAFGLAWGLFTIPAGAGFQKGVVKTYHDRFLQVGVRFTDLGGHDFYGEMLDIDQDGAYHLFDQPLPTAIDIYVFPNYAITLYWLLAL